MVRGADDVVAPALQQVAGVDDDGAGDRGGAHPGALGALDLQAADVVLEQQRDGAVVGVLARAHLVRVGPPHALLDRRVVQQPQRVVAVRRVTVEEVLGQPHAQRDGPHHAHVQLLERDEEALHVGREGPAGVVERLRPLVRLPLDALAPDLHRLLQVRVRRAQPRDLVRVVRLRHLLAAPRHVAAVAVGRGPAQRVLLVLRPREERGRLGEGQLHLLLRHAVVLQVQEPGRLEGVRDLQGRGPFRGAVAVQKRPEVDQLQAKDAQGRVG